MFDMNDAESTFRGLSASAIETLPPAQSFALMFEFYETVRAKGAAPQDEDGDMLLFQWGIHDWGNGDQFELNLSRQIIYPDGDDQDIFQLGLSYFYLPDNTLQALGSDNMWCHSLSDVQEVRTRVLAAPALVQCNERNTASVNLAWQQQ